MSNTDDIGSVLAEIKALNTVSQMKTLKADSEKLLNLYKTEYYKKYSQVPMIGNLHATRATLRNLIKACGTYEKAKTVISNMFGDRWTTAASSLRIKERPTIQLFNFSYSNNLIEILSKGVAAKPIHKTQFNKDEVDI